MFGRKRKDGRRDLYYIFPVSGKAIKKKYFRILFAGIAVGLLFAGLMVALFWVMNRP